MSFVFSPEVQLRCGVPDIEVIADLPPIDGCYIGNIPILPFHPQVIPLDGQDGCDGIDGNDGQDGIDGIDGIGIDGKPGRDGCDGIDGMDAQDGRDGIDGRDGCDGINGMDAQDGRDGFDGRDGCDGVDGQDAQDGRDGFDGRDGCDGVDGLDAQDGMDGADGTVGDGEASIIDPGNVISSLVTSSLPCTLVQNLRYGRTSVARININGALICVKCSTMLNVEMIPAGTNVTVHRIYRGQILGEEEDYETDCEWEVVTWPRTLTCVAKLQRGLNAANGVEGVLADVLPVNGFPLEIDNVTIRVYSSNWAPSSVIPPQAKVYCTYINGTWVAIQRIC